MWKLIFVCPWLMLHSAAVVVRTGSNGKFQARQLQSTLYFSPCACTACWTATLWSDFFQNDCMSNNLISYQSMWFIPLNVYKCHSKAETYTQRGSATRAHMHSIRCSSFIKAHGVFWWILIGWGLRYASIRRILRVQSEAGCPPFLLLCVSEFQ